MDEITDMWDSQLEEAIAQDDSREEAEHKARNDLSVIALLAYWHEEQATQLTDMLS